jgi:methionyl aminopeptidase
MPIVIKTSEDIEGMRLAGRLAAEVLDFITPHVRAGITTGELDRLCHEYMVNVQGTVPAPLNYAPPGYRPFPKAICTSVNHQVCHGIPGDRVLKNGDVLNIHMALVAGMRSGRLNPVVGKELPLAEAPRAHREVIEASAYGKIVLSTG